MAKPLSFLDLAQGVGKGHRAIAATPGAQRINPAMRQAQKGMLPDAVIQQYNDAGIFGKTERGEPIRATMSSTNQDAVKRGYMPQSGKLRLDPESKVPKDLDEAHARGIHPNITWDAARVRPGKELIGSELFMRMQEAARNDPRYQAAMRNPLGTSMPSPVMTELYAMDVKPDGYLMKDPAAAWWSSLPAKGKEMYALAYDMMRAQGHGNVATHLTSVNQGRRLGNVASQSLGHGDLGFISPVEELGHMPGYSGQLFNAPVSSGQSEGHYLQRLFGGKGLKRDRQTDDLMKQADDLRTDDFLGMSPDETLGTLLLREAQLAGAYGPSPGSGSVLRYNQVRPYDNAALKALAEPHVISNSGGIEGAMGPATLGRQGTTEAIVRGLMQGVEPEVVVKMLMDQAPPGGFKGRYKKGGLAHAAVIS
jgi:hypothetical protein